MRLLVNLYGWVLDYRYAVVCVLRDLISHPNSAEQPVRVVSLPGIFEQHAFSGFVVHHIESQGVAVGHFEALGYNVAPLPKSASMLMSYLREHDLRDVVIVAHSKGGLIAKYAMVFEDTEGRISRLIAFSTPFSGSRYAKYFPLRSVREMAPRSEMIRMLQAETAVNARITSIYARWDPHIPGGCALEGAENIVIDTVGHFRLLNDPRLFELIRI